MHELGSYFVPDVRVLADVVLLLHIRLFLRAGVTVFLENTSLERIDSACLCDVSEAPKDTFVDMECFLDAFELI